MFNIFKKKINKKWTVLIAVILGIFLKVQTAKAAAPLLIGGLLAGAGLLVDLFTGQNFLKLTLFGAVGGLASLLNYIIGGISIVMTGILFSVLKYNGFINEAVVTTGWPVVRDVCNMFFVLILLVIAFATILRVESYSAKKLLPKLLILAVLINFSKTICGLAIDFSQVIMLTFISALGTSGAGNLYNAFGLQNIFSIAVEKESILNIGYDTTAAIVFGLILLTIATFVIGIYTIIFVFRIIMLWILIILSPLAFLLSAFPQGTKYASQWTQEFVKYIIVGPVLAFFFWLALVSANPSIDIPSGSIYAEVEQGEALNAVMTDAGDTNSMKRFIVSTLLLLGALGMAQQLGVAGGGMAGGFVNKVKGLGVGAVKLGTRAALYAPKQYAKKAGYDVADLALGGLKKLPIIGNLAMEGQQRLKMQRDFAEEKDMRYMKYASEQDLDLVIKRHRATDLIALGARGMESRRQSYKSALVEKVKRGEEWGMTLEEKKANKSKALIDIAQLAGHSVTASGEDAFRDNELGQLWHKFRKENVGVLDDDEIKAYYQGGSGVADPGGKYERKYDYKGLEGGDNSEYFRKGVPGISEDAPGIVAYTASRMRMNQAFDLHHENFASNKVFDAIYDNGNGAVRSLAQIRDRGTKRQKDELTRWMQYRQGLGDKGFKYKPGHAKAGQNIALEDLINNSDDTIIGKSRVIIGGSKLPEVASGISGLGKLERGRLGLNFSEVGLDNKSAAKYLEGDEKNEMARRVGALLSNRGASEEMAKAIEKQIKDASYLVLHNKEAAVGGAERKSALAHEAIHGRLGSYFNENELKSVWANSMTEEDREIARGKVKSVWGDNKMSDEAVMHEYFAEGLTSQTKWAEKDPNKKIVLDNRARNGLNGLIKAKGSNLQAFTTGLYSESPSRDSIKQTISEGISGELKEAIEGLTDTVADLGNGFSALSGVADNIKALGSSVYKNNIRLEKNARLYQDNNNKLDKLASKL